MRSPKYCQSVGGCKPSSGPGSPICALTALLGKKNPKRPDVKRLVPAACCTLLLMPIALRANVAAPGIHFWSSGEQSAAQLSGAMGLAGLLLGT